jgi:GT2 family glycosyltransferase
MDKQDSDIRPEISIIVCHRYENELKAMAESLDRTIGVPFEWIVIDNSSGDYSIFEAYQEGVEQSSAPILCFAHEDIRFHTDNWGNMVEAHFEDPKVGMIGVAGGNCYPDAPSPWWTNAKYNDHLINLIQHWKDKQPKQDYYTFLNEERTFSKAYNNPEGKVSSAAVTIDGLWFCIRRSLFDQISFDTITYDGFHCYDTDISLQVFQKAEVRVVFDILIEHLSDANPNKEFYESLW